jgi:hypothetical protein
VSQDFKQGAGSTQAQTHGTSRVSMSTPCVTSAAKRSPAWRVYRNINSNVFPSYFHALDRFSVCIGSLNIKDTSCRA